MLDHQNLRAILGAVVLFFVGSWALRKWEVYRIKQRTGSKSVRELPNTGFLGLSWLKENKVRSQDGTLLQTLLDRYKHAGETYGIYIMGNLLVQTMDVDNFKAMLTDREAWGVGLRPGRGGWAPALESGVFVSDGTKWEHGRALIKPAVAKGEISHLSKLEKHVVRLLSSIPNGATVNLSDRVKEFTVDSGLDLLLGVGTVDGLPDKEAAEKTEFVHCVDQLFQAIFTRLRTPPFIRFFQFSANRKFRSDAKLMHDYVDRMVGIAAQRVAAQDTQGTIEGKENGKQGYVFADELLRASGGDRVAARWELMTLMVAATETSALLVSNIFWVLARRPDVWEKLQAEVATLEGRLPDYDDVKGMRYLRAVLNESLRIHPIAGNNIRYALKDNVLPRGGGPDGQSKCFVPKHTTVVLGYHATQRKKDVFGPDADDFRPERWLDEGLRPSFNYLPFSGGPRACPGQNLALVSSSYLVARMVQTFSQIENRDPRPYKTLFRVSWTNEYDTVVSLTR